MKLQKIEPHIENCFVTPCVGVWIEIIGEVEKIYHVGFVTPCVGVWIEISHQMVQPRPLPVTPCVGVWIEIVIFAGIPQFSLRHSLRGSVD